MRKNLFFILFVFFILVLHLSADDAILGGDGHNVYPIKTEDIVMDSEKVEPHLYQIKRLTLNAHSTSEIKPIRNNLS